MPADHHVVPDLNQIINFGALADHGVAQRAPVDRRIGADLDIVLNDHAADLRHFQVALPTHGEAEPVLADGDAGVESDLLPTSAWVTRGVRPDIAVAADMHAVADHAARGNSWCRARCGLGADHRAGLDHDAPLLSVALGWTAVRFVGHRRPAPPWA